MGWLRMKRMPMGMPEKSSFLNALGCCRTSGVAFSRSTLPIRISASDDRQEGNGIDPVRPFLPQRGDHQPAQCRPDDGAGIGSNRLQAKCALQIFSRHNVGNQGLPGGAIKGDRDPIHSRDDVDPPDADGAKIGEHPQRQGGSQHGGLGDEQHPPAVESIRHQPADERKQDDRDEPCQPHPADRQRLVGEGAQMPVDRPGLHLGAGN